MPAAPEAVVARVLNAVPARSYEITTLLSLLRVEVTTATPTASVSCDRRPVLRVNPDFVAEHCRTDEHLFLLVMHELHHVLLGHTRLFDRPTPAHNLAFDAVINAMLCGRFPQRAYTSFFLQLYGTSTGAARLLAPPAGRPIADRRLAALHRMLYRRHTVTAAEVFDAIVRAGVDVPTGLLLLGSHGRDRAQAAGMGLDGGGLDPEIAAVIGSVAGRWPIPEEAGRHRGLGGLLQTGAVVPRDPERDVLAVVRRVLTAAAWSRGGPRRRGSGEVGAQAALPTVGDRRALVARAGGGTPLLYLTPLPGRTRRRERRAAIYLDVSGSMTTYVPALYGALRRLRAHVRPQVHLFSTMVETIPLGDLCDGRCDTTGGTEIRCVVEHALHGDARRVLVITDGFTGGATPRQRERIRQRGLDIRVLLTPGGSEADLAPIASRIDVLPTLDTRSAPSAACSLPAGASAPGRDTRRDWVEG
jgi:hypothetical protein